MRERINEILNEKFFCEEIAEDQSLKSDLGMDSLNVVELIVELEEVFGIEIDESDLDPAELQTVGQIYSLIEKYSGM